MTPDDQLERTQWDLFWAPTTTRIVDRPELRFCYDPSGRTELNTVVRTRASADRLPALIDEVLPLQGPASTWLVVETVDVVPLETALARAGYHDDFAARAYTRAVTHDPVRPPRRGLRVERITDRQTLRDAIWVSQRAFGRTPEEPSDERLTQEVAVCAPPDSRVRRFVVYDGDEPICTGGLNVFAELGFGFLWAGGTAPEARGRGAYTALVDARAAEAARSGLSRIGLYARLATSAPIVAKQGFEAGSRMFYWRRPGR